MNIGKDTVRKIVVEDLRKGKICSRFVPHSLTQRDNRQAVFGPTKSDCAWPPSVFARFSTCWLCFVPKSEIPLEGAPLWLVFGHPDSRDRFIKHHCKERLPQRHPESEWPCKSVCTVTRDLCRKPNSKSVISFKQILFTMPVLNLSRRTVYKFVCVCVCVCFNLILISIIRPFKWALIYEFMKNICHLFVLHASPSIFITIFSSENDFVRWKSLRKSSFKI